jgi:hypothetical protein
MRGLFFTALFLTIIVSPVMAADDALKTSTICLLRDCETNVLNLK